MKIQHKGMLCKYLFYYKSFRYAILKVTLAKKSLFEFPALILAPRQTPKLHFSFNNQYGKLDLVSHQFEIFLMDIARIFWLDLPFSGKSFFKQTAFFVLFCLFQALSHTSLKYFLWTQQAFFGQIYLFQGRAFLIKLHNFFHYITMYPIQCM